MPQAHAQGDKLISHQYSSRKNLLDTSVPANGVSLVVSTNEAHNSTTQEYTLQDAKKNTFLRVETFLA